MKVTVFSNQGKWYYVTCSCDKRIVVRFNQIEEKEVPSDPTWIKKEDCDSPGWYCGTQGHYMREMAEVE